MCISLRPEGTGPISPVREFYEQLLAKLGGVEGLKQAIGQGPDAVAARGSQRDADFGGRWFEAVSRLGPAAPESAKRVIRAALNPGAPGVPPPVTFEPYEGKRHALTAPVPDIAAIRAAGWTRDAAAVPLLVPWLSRHEHQYHAAESALALGRIGTAGAVQALWDSAHREIPNRRIYLNRYLQHGPLPEEYSLLHGLVLAGAAPKLDDVPLVIAMLPGTFLEKPRYEDRLRPESQRVLLGRLLLDNAALRRKSVDLLVSVLRGDAPQKDDPLYQQILKGINLERPFSEHGRPFPVVAQIEPEQALWLLGCLATDRSEVPEALVLPYLKSHNERERIDAAVLLGRLGVSAPGAQALFAEVMQPYPFKEIASIGKGRPDPDIRDKCYMIAALAQHANNVERLRPLADPKTAYRDVRYGLALGLGYRGRTDGIDLLKKLATADPISTVRRQARESLLAIQQAQRMEGRPVPAIELPDSVPAETLYPPRGLDWPGPVAAERPAGDPPGLGAPGLQELRQAIAEGLKPERYRNLNNVNDQAPGAKFMMVRGSASLVQAVQLLSTRQATTAEPELRRLLDSPYPLAHYLALRELAAGGHPDLDEVLIAKLAVFAKSADTASFYWTCEALAGRGVQAAIPALARYARPESPPGIHGPLGMGLGYPAAKAIARLAARPSHTEVARLVTHENAWLRAGTLAGLAEADAPGIDELLRRAGEQDPSALVRAEAQVQSRLRGR